MQNTIIQGDCLEVMRGMDDDSVDLTVTSPPYDNVRDYKGYSFDFENIAEQLFRVTKQGGIVVWVVADATIKGNETGTSFKQALHFKDVGFNLYDTMIYHRQAGNPPYRKYWQNFEYMFVLSKGKPNTANIIRDRKNKYRRMGGDAVRQKDGSVAKGERGGIKFNEYGIRENIWYYAVGKGNTTKDGYAFQHPAMFPEKMVADHITSWTNENDIVLDPFSGAGTTAKMAVLANRRYIGIELSEEYCEISRKRVQEAKYSLHLLED